MRKAKLNELGDKLLSKHYRKLKRNRPTIEQVREEAKRYDETFLKNRFEHSCQPNFDLVAYVQCNRHRQGLPYLTISVRELDVLMRYVPGPLGLGMDVKAIANDMHCIERLCNAYFHNCGTSCRMRWTRSRPCVK
jgi:hypothetical protein